MVMGTASTMASMVESLGLAFPYNAALPAVDSRRYAMAHLAGRRMVSRIRDDVRQSHILTRPAFENAIRVNGALGGSTNAVIHLLAIAGRVGVPLTLDDWDQVGRNVPTIVDLKPSGRFLMEDFHYAGGLPAVIRSLGEHGLIHRDAMTVNGKTLWENCGDAPCWNTEVVRPFDRPLAANGGMAVLRGNLAPDGAVLKPSAASPHLMKHRGRAVVFDTIEHYKSRINDPALPVDPSSILVLRNSGPVGYPGMAEVGNMGLPPAVLKQGVTDMVRISDARMSGTAYGTVSCTSARKRPSAGRWHSSRKGISSSSTSKRAGCTWT
jgi:dihydroxyacid dehydratase/phosphogluconate dehydratase